MKISGNPILRPAALQPPPRPLSPLAPDSARATGASGLSSFSDLLVNQVQQVNQMQTSSESMMQSLLTGGDVNEAEVLTSMQKADLAFRMLLQMRNKLMEAYREVQQIQI